MVSLKVNFGSENSIEVDAMNEDELARIVNRATKKFFPHTKWTDNDDY